MSINPIQPLEFTAVPQAGVANLGLVREQREAGGVNAEAEQLRSQLATERSAGRALLAAVGELESRLNAERATGQALLGALRDLDGTLQAERAELRSQREASGRLWWQVSELNGALDLAERPLWRKLLRRS